MRHYRIFKNPWLSFETTIRPETKYGCCIRYDIFSHGMISSRLNAAFSATRSAAEALGDS